MFCRLSNRMKVIWGGGGFDDSISFVILDTIFNISQPDMFTTRGSSGIFVDQQA